MLSRIIPSPLKRTVSKLSTFDSITGSGPGQDFRGSGPWLLTIPQLETNTESSALLPWRSQIPMTVRYKIPEIPKSSRQKKNISREVETLLSTQLQGLCFSPNTSVVTPNGVASWGNITTPAQNTDGVIEDPVVTRETYQAKRAGIHRFRINRTRPKPQIAQRIRRKRRRLQKLWDTKEKERQKAIIKLREDNFRAEKKRVQSSDWWDWYVPYDNKPMQF